MTGILSWNFKLPANGMPVISCALPANTLVITGAGTIAFQGNLADLRKLHTSLGAELVLADAERVSP